MNKERKTSKALLTEKVDHFFWHCNYCQGGTKSENARSLPGLIPKLEEQAAEIVKLLENAGKLVLADSWLVGYAKETVPAKLASMKARLPEALAENACQALQKPLVDTSEAQPLESSPIVNLVPFPSLQEKLPPWQAEKEPTSHEIREALVILKRASPQAIQKVLDEKA